MYTESKRETGFGGGRPRGSRRSPAAPPAAPSSPIEQLSGALRLGPLPTPRSVPVQRAQSGPSASATLPPWVRQKPARASQRSPGPSPDVQWSQRELGTHHLASAADCAVPRLVNGSRHQVSPLITPARFAIVQSNLERSVVAHPTTFGSRRPLGSTSHPAGELRHMSSILFSSVKKLVSPREGRKTETTG